MSPEWRPHRMVCLCNGVTAHEIKTVLKAGARTTAEIQELTFAGTGCTRCVREIDAIVAEYHANHPAEPQLRLDL